MISVTETPRYHPERVDLAPISGLIGDLSCVTQLGHLVPSEVRNSEVRRFTEGLPRELAKIRRQFGLNPVRAPAGNTGYFKMRLRDGTFGYFQRRMDDCLQAAIASLVQIPPYLVPDIRLNEIARTIRLENSAAARPVSDEALSLQLQQQVGLLMDQWAERNGMTFRIRPILPRNGRWVGVWGGNSSAETEPFADLDHCVLMSGRELLFDPSDPLPIFQKRFDIGDVEYGITEGR